MKIKRATTEGLKESEGDFFEENGSQWCLVEDEGFYFCIELSSGCSIGSFETDDYSKKDALRIAKEEINKRSKIEFEKAFKKVSEDYCSKYKFSLPVNEPVLNGL